EEAAAWVGEALEQRIEQRRRELEVGRTPAVLQELDERAGEERVIVEIGRKTRAAVLVHGVQAAVDEKLGANEVDGALRGGRELGARKPPRCWSGRADYEAVPRSDDLLVAAGRHALSARGKQLSAHGLDLGLRDLRRAREV